MICVRCTNMFTEILIILIYLFYDSMKIDGEYRSHLRFAEDILICANTPHELQQILQELANESDNQVMKMTKSKTKMMMETYTPIYVNNTQIENVESYICLGQRCSAREKNQDKEI